MKFKNNDVILSTHTGSMYKVLEIQEAFYILCDLDSSKFDAYASFKAHSRTVDRIFEKATRAAKLLYGNTNEIK